MVSTPERFTDNSPISPGSYVTVKNPSAIKSGSMLWSSIKKSIGHTKINELVKKYLHNWILQHPQVVQSPIAYDCLKVSIDGHYKPQLVPKLLLQVTIRELHNSIIISPEEGGLKEARCSDNNISISGSTLRSILPPQLNNISSWYKFMCGCECRIFAKNIHSSLPSWRDCYLNKLKYLSQNEQNRRSGQIYNRLFETYKNSVMPHGRHIYATASDMSMAAMSSYTPSQHALPHWKYVLHCCANFPCIDLPYQ